MKDSFTDGFLFFTESRFSLISRILPHTAHGISLSSFIRFTIAPISVVIPPDAGATLIHGVIPCALRDTCISPATNISPTSQSTRLKIYPAFGCALRGPFGSLHLDPVSASRTLCARICCFDLRFNGFGVFDFSSIYYDDVKCQIF